MIRKVLSVLAIIICLVMIFSTNGFALEYVDFNQEIDVFCEYVKNEIIVVTHDDGNDEVIKDIFDKYNFKDYSLLMSDTDKNGAVKSIYLVHAEIENMSKYCYSVSSENGVYSAEPNYIGHFADSTEEEVNTYWHVDHLGYKDMQAYLSENNITPREITIAVLDSGFDINNGYFSMDNFVDIENGLYHGYDATGDTVGYNIYNPNVDHGTSVISTIVCQPYNGRVVGINPYVKILPIRANSSDPNESDTVILSSVIRGLGYISGSNKIYQGEVDIVSLSLVFNLNNNNSNLIQCLKSSIDTLEDEDILVFAAAGNYAAPVHNFTGLPQYDSGVVINYPAAYDNGIGVMGSNVDGEIWQFSAFGTPDYELYNDYLGYDIIAPAVSVFGLKYDKNLDDYEMTFLPGTSFATPLSAAAAAYYLSLKPQGYTATKDEIVSLFHAQSYSKTWNSILYQDTIPTVDLTDIIKNHAATQNTSYILARDSSTCIIDRSNHYIYGLSESLTYSSLMNTYIEASGGYTVSKYDNDYTYYGTGSKVRLTNPDNNSLLAEYTIIIFGDMDGDGLIRATDAAILHQHYMYSTNLSYPVAGDVINFGDGITLDDVYLLQDAAAGYAEIIQVPQ